jgi:hypothetical protein
MDRWEAQIFEAPIAFIASLVFFKTRWEHFLSLTSLDSHSFSPQLLFESIVDQGGMVMFKWRLPFPAMS